MLLVLGISIVVNERQRRALLDLHDAVQPFVPLDMPKDPLPPNYIWLPEPELVRLWRALGRAKEIVG